MIVLIFLKTFLDNKMSIFEEYGAFKVVVHGIIMDEWNQTMCKAD